MFYTLVKDVLESEVVGVITDLGFERVFKQLWEKTLWDVPSFGMLLFMPSCDLYSIYCLIMLCLHERKIETPLEIVARYSSATGEATGYVSMHEVAELLESQVYMPLNVCCASNRHP